MHICFPSLSYPFNGEPTSGVGSQVRLLAHALTDAGLTASVIDLTTEKPTVTNDARGVRVCRVAAGKFHWFFSKIPLVGKLLALPLRELEYSLAVWRGIRTANEARPIDLIEGTETGMLIVALFWNRSPVIIRLHGEQYTFHKHTPDMPLTVGVRLSRVLQRMALRRAKLLISPSYAHAREIQRELGAPLPPIVVVPNALGVEKTNGKKETSRTANTVLYAGRIEQRKGIRILLHAAARTRDVLPDSRFVFAGDFHSSISPVEFQSLIKSHNLDANVDLVGPVGWKALSDLYRQATVAVLPSHYETFGLAALEPMAFGTPVVASDTGALPEVVINEENGKLFAAGDCGALANAMIDLLSHPAACEELGKGAIKHAAQFDVGKMLPLNERLYRWCLRESFPESNPHVFFSPHLDDAVLSCGGAIHSLASQQKSVRVITVFAGGAEVPQSAFARHLHKKWNADSDVIGQRRKEDREALRQLGVTNLEHWEYDEAPYRRGGDDSPLYTTHEGLRGSLAEPDRGLVDALTERIINLESTGDATLYFPLALGQHVDHRILFEVGRNLNASGKNVRFYEDFPYAEKYERDGCELNWLPQTVSIDLKSKVRAASVYATQIPGLGGSAESLEKRLRAFGADLASRRITERYWQFVAPVRPSQKGKSPELSKPNNLLECSLQSARFKNFLATFRWHDLDEVLPVGSGSCIDVGCGSGRHKSLIENRGYQWCGCDRSDTNASICCDATALPVDSESQAAMVGWQMLEYVERPEEVIAEAARALEPGGVFCGSVSFLEPVHGRTYFNISPLILEKLLAKHGFADIEIKAGLNGFALMLWTWLRRSGIPYAYLFAIPITFLMFVPVAGLLFSASWLSQLLGFGTGHLMRWLSQAAPLEFAGHVMFSARKKASVENCTSPS